MAGYFISLEGLDGSGKSTIAKQIGAALRALHHEVVSTREPGGTALGERVRTVLFQAADRAMLPEAEALMFAAARAQLVGEVIRPALERNAFVVADRFADSSLAYQCGGRGLPRDQIRIVQDLATAGLNPDLTILLDMRPELSLARRRRDNEESNRLDREHLDFYHRVRSEYLMLAAAEPDRWRIIDAARSAAEVWQDVWAAIDAPGGAELRVRSTETANRSLET